MMPPHLLSIGRKTWSWVQEGGKPDRAALSVRLMYRWQSRWFERNRALQTRLEDAAGKLESDPVFIIGLWRSGTTYLHQLVSAGPGMISPSTWQCMNPSAFSLRPAPKTMKSSFRPMDQVTVDASSPQEDEFALLALGVPSVYRGILDPRRLPDLVQWLEPDNWTRADPKGWRTEWTQFLAGVSRGQNGRLVLKSPSHSFRVAPLAVTYPNSPFIWISRDPQEIFFSNRKMWTAMFDRYALWTWDQRTLDAFLCRAFELAAKCLHRATALLPQERLVIVPFQQLVSSPVETMGLINHRIGLGECASVLRSTQEMVKSNAGHNRGQLNHHSGPTEATSALRRAMESLRTAQVSAFASHGL